MSRLTLGRGDDLFEYDIRFEPLEASGLSCTAREIAEGGQGKVAFMAFFGHKEHLVRMAALFGVGIVTFLVLQALLVPKGFGVYGHYRGGALEENRARPVAFAGRAACVECHADVPEAAKGGAHAGIRCEACHGPLAAHAGDPTEKKAVRPDSRVLCARCHAGNVARPARFPQVDPAEHSGGEACTTCHKAHNPAVETGGAK